MDLDDIICKKANQSKASSSYNNKLSLQKN